MKSAVVFVVLVLTVCLILGALVGTDVIPLRYTALRKKNPVKSAPKSARKRSKNTVATPDAVDTPETEAAYVRYNDKTGIRDSKNTNTLLNVIAQDSEQKNTEHVLGQKVHNIVKEENLKKEKISKEAAIDIVGETVVDKQFASAKGLDDVFAIRDQDGFDKQWATNDSNNQASEKVKKAAKGRALLMPEFSQNSQPSRMIGQSNDIAYKLLRPQKELKVTNPVEWNGSDHHNMQVTN